MQAKAKILVPGKLGRGGVMSNVDLVDLRPEYRAREERFEENLHAMGETMKEATGFLGMGAGLPSVVGRNHMKSYEDIMEERRRGDQVEAIFYDEVENRWIIPDEYKAVWAAGYLCQHCLGWQQIPHHHMCNTVHGGSCGIPNPFAAELNGYDVQHDMNA